jgi:hypothetical protein
VSDPDRHKFEEEYLSWLLSVAKDAARCMAAMPVSERELTARNYKQLMDPKSVFHKLSDPKRLVRLAGDKISRYIVVETEAITFFPSIYSSVPGALDFSVAMNRRFYYRELWFPIIALNSDYIRKSSDKILGFTLEHEFEMSKIYQQISLNLRNLSGDEKREIASSAQKTSADRLQITQGELIEDERLMVQLSKSRPLIPKPYAEMALLLYLEDNLLDLRLFGVPSESDEESSFGAELYKEFQGWADFSRKTYASFVRELLADLKESDRGYD